jgi:hypothetical protein
MTDAEFARRHEITRSNQNGVPLAILAAAFLGLFAADNVLLLQFLGLPVYLTTALALVAIPSMALMAGKMIIREVRVPWRAIGICGAIALVLFLLGGQGRIFYANADWQVRDAILADMARYPWPFAYLVEGKSAILRAPIGLYLLPSLAGGGMHEWAMLVSNTLRLTLLFAMCWPLFSSNKHRWIAITIFLLFSGLDILGTALFSQMGANVSWDHLERWNFNNQYSAHITQAFWVPQHALAGWACAATYLLWQKGLCRIGLFAATIPLVAIWSPLAIMGSVPFALAAGFSVLRNGNWDKRDVLLAGAALAVALPSLAYLQLDAAELGSKLRVIGLPFLIFIYILEVFPLVLPALLARDTDASDKPTLWIIFACLLSMPLYQIGASSDFQMRASIMPLALLAILFAKWFMNLLDNPDRPRTPIIYAIAVMLIGAATPLFEIHRAITHDTSPKPGCSLVGVWGRQQGLMIAPYATYFARAEMLPKFLDGMAIRAGKNDPQKCWGRPWPVSGSD